MAPAKGHLNGIPLEVYLGTWEEDSIHVKLPQEMSSRDAYGDLVVEIRGHKSNVVPITQWTGTMTRW